MIDYIDKIEDYGIFLKHGKSPVFTRHTAIYGWNGSGKTTLSKLFAELGKDNKAFPLSKYKVQVSGTTIDQSTSNEQGIVVFNEDYVRENSPSINDVSQASKHIFSIGKESKGLIDEIKSDTEISEKLDLLLNKKDENGTSSLKDRYKEKVKQYDKLFTDIARTISASSTGVAARNYRSDKAKISFEKIDRQINLNNADTEKLRKLASQERKDEIHEVVVESLIKRLGTVHDKSSKLASKTVVRSTITELEKTQERSDWALFGLKLHKHDGLTDCLFCGSKIQSQRWSELESFFNEEYQVIYDGIVSIRDELRDIYAVTNSLRLPDPALFYQDMQGDYIDLFDKFNGTTRGELLNQIKVCGQQINTKLQNLNKDVELDLIDVTSFTLHLDAVNQQIQKHNDRSNNIEKDREKVFGEIECRYLSSIHDEARTITEQRDGLGADIEKNEIELGVLKRRIAVNEAKTRNSHLGCEEINITLWRLLGRNDLRLEDEDVGYRIYRNDELAVGLSEGEKTVITFSYFLAYATIDEEKLKKSVVIIDDPVSSLDIDMIYKVFAAIRSRLGKAKQLIILTHNFEVLNHVKKWYKSDRDSSPLYSLLMVRNDLQDKRRCAYIEPLDPTLEKYETEYHYLFDRLVKLREELKGGGEPQLAHVYNYPNIARKVVECYLAFKTPNGKSVSSGLRSLHNSFKEIVSSEMTNDIDSFINSGSHLDSKTGLLQFDATLTKNIKHYIEATLGLIELTDELHYKAMIK